MCHLMFVGKAFSNITMRDLSVAQFFHAISLGCCFRTFKNGFYTLTDMSGKATQLQPVKNPVQTRGPPATYTVIATTTTDSIPKAATNPGLPARERLQK